jgi:hypothetical protein
MVTKKLPVLALLIEAARLTWDQRLRALRLFVPLAAIETALRAVVLRQENWVLWVGLLVPTLIVVPWFTAWHRLVLFGAAEGVPRLGGGERRYLAKAVTLIAAGLALLIPVIFAAAFAAIVFPLPVVEATEYLVEFILLGLAAPFLLCLPAAAADRDLPLMGCWPLAKGNVMRLAAVLVLAYLPAQALSLLSDRLFPEAAIGWGLPLLASPLEIGALSLAYRFLTADGVTSG